MKNWGSVSKLVIITAGLTVASVGHAQETSPYSFSGPCNSQGSWSRAALAHTQEVKSIITKLKDNPACNALKTRIEGSLEGINEALQNIDRANEISNGEAQTLQKLPHEIGALRTFARENSLFKSNVIQLLMGKTVTYSALSSQRVDGRHIDPADTSASLAGLSQRTHHAAMTGLTFFNSTLSAIQEAQAGCLDDSTGTGAIAGMVKVLSSFAASGDQGLSPQMAMAVQNLGQYLGRDKKYVNALRKLNDREFISSMSCLMEITTDGYCSVLDAQYMFREILNSQSLKIQEYTNKRTGQVEKKIVGMNENFAKRLENGPLAGYYILTRQVAVVTEWIQKVQYGITPQLPTEADFQIAISTNVYEFNNSLKKIEGTFNFKKGLMAEIADFKAKQTYALEMLNEVAQSMLGRRMMGGGQSENFFAKVSTPAEIHFRLLGIPVPDAVRGIGPEAFQFTNNPESWLNAKYRTHPLFTDPDKLTEIIFQNMQQVFEEATVIAVSYYNKYFIADKLQVVNDSLLGLDVNVRDALTHIDRYLQNLEMRIRQDSSDPTMVGSILDTRRRIGRILRRYRDLRDYSLSLIQQAEQNGGHQKLDDDEMARKLRQVGDLLLQQVYKEFEVLTARTGFLSKRMAAFVFQDYTISLRKRDEFDQYFEDLMLATGYNTLNMMMNMSQTEFSKIKTDLDQAMNIYKGNIDALEDVLKAGYSRNIFELKLMAKGDEITEYQRAQMAMQTSEKIGSAKIPGEESNSVQRGLRGLLTQMWMDMTSQDQEVLGAPSQWGKLVLPLKQLGNWMLGNKGKIVVSPVSEFDAAEGEMAKLCTQTLAFPNLRPYWELCQNSVLLSPLMNKNAADPEVKSVVENYLSVNYVKKAWEHLDPKKEKPSGKERARNYQARICALRDYHRRNEVARMTSAMRENGDLYENEFTKVIRDEVAAKPSAQPQQPQPQQPQPQPQPLPSNEGGGAPSPAL